MQQPDGHLDLPELRRRRHGLSGKAERVSSAIRSVIC